MMTIEEAHIKATLLYGDKHDGSIFVSVSTTPGDDSRPYYEILIPGWYDMGDNCLGAGETWEAAFQMAEEEQTRREEEQKKFESKRGERDEAKKKQDKEDKKRRKEAKRGKKKC